MRHQKTTQLTPTACTRCDTEVLRGYVEGREVTVDRWTIPSEHARILALYRPADVLLVLPHTFVGATRWYARAYYPEDIGLAALVHGCGNKWRVPHGQLDKRRPTDVQHTTD